jgi:hypothetical protein
MHRRRVLVGLVVVGLCAGVGAVSGAAENLGVEETALNDAVKGGASDRLALAMNKSGLAELNGYQPANLLQPAAWRFDRISAYLDDLAAWSTRATALARGAAIFSTVAEYGALVTSASWGAVKNGGGCCWKLW